MNLLKAGVQTEEKTVCSDIKKRIHGIHVDRSSRKICISVSAKPFSFIFLTLYREKLIQGSAVLCTREESEYRELFNHIHQCFSGDGLWTSDVSKTAEKELPKPFRKHINYKV